VARGAFEGGCKGKFDQAGFFLQVYIWEGKLWKLRADAILNSTNESMTDRYGLSGQILEKVTAFSKSGLVKCRAGHSVD